MININIRKQLDILKAPPIPFGDLPERKPNISFDGSSLQDPTNDNIEAYYDRELEPQLLEARNKFEDTFLISQAEFHAMSRGFNSNATQLKKLIKESLEKHDYVVESTNKGLNISLKQGKPTDIDMENL